MDFETYQQLFFDTLNSPAPAAPYDNPDYLNYTKLNWSRQQRWLKVGVLNTELTDVIENIVNEQHWMVITELWCGDASHTIPFIHRLSELNPLIKVKYQLRDSPPFLIEQYLTNGTRSIPKLIIADSNQNDLGVWGPRPAECQKLYLQMVHDHVDMAEKKIALQKWYNEDKGESFQREFLAILQSLPV
ncbi:thioredoxin family protein [Mucilaginibacter sp. CAU 1740]|uniref:thioredoxin family protein n=1 Tax=Mucilaginibacter sp. CAU 1740 TaxID=3140365 RepID=UPI00325BB386